MKRLITIILIFSTLCLTACNNQTVETSISTSQSEHTDTFSTPKTEENPETTTQGTVEENRHPEIPGPLKNQIVGIGTTSFLELPSRILFSATLSKDVPVNDEYRGTSSDYLVYYSKADGEIYINCFDPLCEHKGCSGVGSLFLGSSQFFIGDRFYEISPLGEIESFSFDGTDRRIEFDAGYGDYEGAPPWGRNRLAYDRYIYIDFLTENEEYHTLRYDTETQTMEDMTEKTGNYILPLYAYNGEIYGRDVKGLAIKTDQSLSYIKEAYNVYSTGSYNCSWGSCMVGLAKGRDEETGRMTKTMGIQSYDIETETYTLLTNETIGHTVSQVVLADENYYYFFAKEPVYIGLSHQETAVYNQTGGKIYRINHDGSDCICIYENPGLRITDLYIYENTVFASACRLGLYSNIAQTWDWSTYIGKINEDGTIESLEWVEVIA